MNISHILSLFLLLVPILSKINGINMASLSQVMKIGDESLFVFLNSARSFDKINKQYAKFINEFDNYIEELNLPNYQVVKIAMTDTDDDGEIHETERLTSSFGVDMDYAPHIVFVDKKLDKYRYNGSFIPRELKQFIEDARAQKIPCFYRSQQIPQEQQKGLLKKVVANNFVKKVWESPEQILLYISKQDCNDCEKFQTKILSKVIERTKTTPDLLYYKIDSSLNELLGLANLGREPYVLYFSNPKRTLPPFFDDNVVSAENIINWMKTCSKFGIRDPVGELADEQL